MRSRSPLLLITAGLLTLSGSGLMGQKPSHLQTLRSAALQLDSGSRDEVKAHVSTLTSGYITPGVAKDLVDARIADLQLRHLRGELPKISEAAVVRALNHLADRIGLPEYGKTNPLEFRLFRMSTLRVIPELNPKALTEPDEFDTEKGKHIKSVSSKMTPVEVAFLICSLTLQKSLNSQFQQTEGELQRQFTDYETNQMAHKSSGDKSETAPKKREIKSLMGDTERAGKIQLALHSFAAQASRMEDVEAIIDSFVKEVGYER